MKTKLLILLILIFIGFIYCQAQSTSDQCEPPSPSSPGGDAPDDNASFSSIILSNSVFDYELNPNIGILNNGYSDSMEKLITSFHVGKYYLETNFNPSLVLDKIKTVLIPSGGLFGLENDAVFKTSLQEYVRLGGTVIVFAQQYGSHIDNVVPIPEGESLRSYGWREDQSCMGMAGYFNQMHPVLASQTSKRVSINVDGYFDTYPSNATVLLRRVSNQQPCLISYPYGEGTVILTTMYTDWGAAHSQASTSELRLVRDLVTYAKNPNLAIPMHNLTANLHPDISLNVTVKNEGETAASKVKFKVYAPDRKTVLYETEASLVLDAGAESVVPVNFNLSAALTSNQ